MNHGRKRAARSLRVVAAALALPIAMTVGASASAADAGYHIVSTPNSGSGGLLALSCPAPTHCVAVGQSFKTGALIESSDGATWSLATGADTGTNSSLDGVSCPTANFCVAVGSANGAILIETWRGSAWTIETSPNPANSGANLQSVSCVSRSRCVAVGGFAAMSTPLESRPLAESWDGTHWTLMKPPRPARKASDLDAVSCPTATDCVAVGYANAPQSGDSVDAAALIEQLHGSSWSMDTAPDSGLDQTFLDDVSCVDRQTCVAVGWGDPQRAVAMKLDGAVWSVTTTATPHDRDLLQAVSCASATHCIAAGYQAGSVPVTHVESFDGAVWTAVPSDNYPGANTNDLWGASCPKHGRCFVAGFIRGIGLGERTLVLTGR
jgi:hypothetical protein